MGYKLVREVASGGFGTVYEAEGPDQSSVAIKLLREAIRNDPNHLQSFRRGVRSMRILSQANIPGVVRYHEEFEIPAIAVMDLVPGHTLHDAIQRRALDWRTSLDIAIRLATIVRQSHQLPSRVLHRDLRPKNIMVKQKWEGDEDWEIVVLDFDLSYHKDAQEKSVAIESYSGFLAPEQVDSNSRYSSRNALVDSYGLGMTLYFIRTRQEPSFNQPAQSGWMKHLGDLAERHKCKEWASLPQRYFRLIQNCTLIEQPERWDMVEIENELLRLRKAFTDPQKMESAELLAEEVAARAFSTIYEWDSDQLAAVRKVTEDTKILVRGYETARCVSLEASWVQTGKHHRGDTKTWTNETGAKAATLLNRAGWSIRSNRQSANELRAEAEIPVEVLRERLRDAAEAVSRVSDALIRR